MNKSIGLALSLLALNFTPVFAQPTAPVPGPGGRAPSYPLGPTFEQRLQMIQNSAASGQSDAPALTRFSLDFPGGTPKELAAAIEQATSKPLNVIIFDEDAATKLPPIKMSGQDVANLFKTLSDNSVKYVGNGNEVVRSYGFKTIDQRPSDNSLWTFYAYSKPTLQTQFSLDFPGGTPPQLVKALEKAMGKPLNVIINKEDENIELPALKMDNVFLPQLFTALEVASRKMVAISNPGTGNRGFGSSYQQVSTGFGFKTDDNRPSDTSVWYFHVEKPILPPVDSIEKSCRFYSLGIYLNRGFTVDDITTAIQTGWKLAGEKAPPELNYHKETKLLIAYGEPAKLQTIQQVLETLPAESATQTTQTRAQLDELARKLDVLQHQVDALKGNSAGPTGAAAEEKAGK